MTYLIQTGKGETFNLNLTYLDASGIPIDLTTHVVTFEILTPNSPGAPALITKTCTTTSDGHIAVTLSATETNALAEGEYIYVLIDTFGSVVDWLLRDRFDILEVSSIV